LIELFWMVVRNLQDNQKKHHEGRE